MKLGKKKTGDVSPRPRAAEILAAKDNEQDSVSFNPDQDLTAEIFSKVKEELDSYRQESKWGLFTSVAYNLAFLYPERKAELGLDEEAWLGIKGELDLCREESQMNQFYNVAKKFNFTIS